MILTPTKQESLVFVRSNFLARSPTAKEHEKEGNQKSIDRDIATMEDKTLASLSSFAFWRQKPLPEMGCLYFQRPKSCDFIIETAFHHLTQCFANNNGSLE